MRPGGAGDRCPVLYPPWKRSTWTLNLKPAKRSLLRHGPRCSLQPIEGLATAGTQSAVPRLPNFPFQRIGRRSSLKTAGGLATGKPHKYIGLCVSELATLPFPRLSPYSASKTEEGLATAEPSSGDCFLGSQNQFPGRGADSNLQQTSEAAPEPKAGPASLLKTMEGLASAKPASGNRLPCSAWQRMIPRLSILNLISARLDLYSSLKTKGGLATAPQLPEASETQLPEAPNSGGFRKFPKLPRQAF